MDGGRGNKKEKEKEDNQKKGNNEKKFQEEERTKDGKRETKIVKEKIKCLRILFYVKVVRAPTGALKES